MDDLDFIGAYFQNQTEENLTTFKNINDGLLENAVNVDLETQLNLKN